MSKSFLLLSQPRLSLSFSNPPMEKNKLVDGSLVCDGVVDLGVRKLEVVDLGRWCEDADCGLTHGCG
jgi:hypothetical protein